MYISKAQFFSEMKHQTTAPLLAGPSTCPETQPAVGVKQPAFMNSSQHGLKHECLNSSRYSQDVYSKYPLSF